MFQLSDEECEILRCKNSISSWGRSQIQPLRLYEARDIIYAYVKPQQSPYISPQSGGSVARLYLIYTYQKKND